MAWGARNLIPYRYGRRYAKNQIALNLLRHINELNKRHDTEEVDVETFAAFVNRLQLYCSPRSRCSKRYENGFSAARGGTGGPTSA